MLNIIRDYPIRKRDYNALHQQKITANIDDVPGGGGASRSAENAALRQLPKAEQREYDAVHLALQITAGLRDGKTRLSVAHYTLITGRYTIAGAAMRLGIPEEKARTYRWEFIMAVGYTYGFIEKDEYLGGIERRKNRYLHSQGQNDVL